MGKAVGITLNPRQSLVAYASALKAIFAAAELRRETLPRSAPTRTEPAPSSASGPSEQALAEELDRIADDLESLLPTSAPHPDAPSPKERKPAPRDDPSSPG
ncbi:MAG: hypothetical protein KGI89_17105 [Euryarchaeota archaeon]|nr:hypothetical protein [Euryarchaeota archaeon]